MNNVYECTLTRLNIVVKIYTQIVGSSANSLERFSVVRTKNCVTSFLWPIRRECNYEINTLANILDAIVKNLILAFVFSTSSVRGDLYNLVNCFVLVKTPQPVTVRYFAVEIITSMHGRNRGSRYELSRFDRIFFFSFFFNGPILTRTIFTREYFERSNLINLV